MTSIEGVIMSEDLMVKLNDENFEEEIKKGVTLVDFYADWCGPCQMLAPVLEEVAQKIGSKAQFKKLDIDKNHTIAGNYQVTSVPTMILYKEGKEVNRLVGLHDAKTIEDFVNEAI